MCRRTLCTVTRYRTHSDFIFTNTLRDECRRTTAIAVSSPLTAKSKHGFSKLIIAETYRIISSTAIIHTNNESSVFLNTDHRTRRSRRRSLLGLLNQLTVFYGHSKRYTNSMKKSTTFEIIIKLGFVKRLNITRNSTIFSLEHIENRRCGIKNRTTGSYVFAKITDAFSVVNKYTRRITLVIKVSIHTTDDVVPEVILIILRHFCEFLMRPVCLIIQIFIDLIVSRNDGYIRI